MTARTGTAGLLPRVAGLARRHVGLLVLLTVASPARRAVVLAYSTALWFPDSLTYLNGALAIEPVDRPFGCSAFLGCSTSSWTSAGWRSCSTCSA